MAWCARPTGDDGIVGDAFSKALNHLHPQDRATMMDAIAHLRLHRNHHTDVRYFFEMSYWCGLRVGEALRVTPNSIDLPALIIYLSLIHISEPTRPY